MPTPRPRPSVMQQHADALRRLPRPPAPPTPPDLPAGLLATARRVAAGDARFTDDELHAAVAALLLTIPAAQAPPRPRLPRPGRLA